MHGNSAGTCYHRVAYLALWMQPCNTKDQTLIARAEAGVEIKKLSLGSSPVSIAAIIFSVKILRLNCS